MKSGSIPEKTLDQNSVLKGATPVVIRQCFATRNVKEYERYPKPVLFFGLRTDDPDAKRIMCLYNVVFRL